MEASLSKGLERVDNGRIQERVTSTICCHPFSLTRSSREMTPGHAHSTSTSGPPGPGQATTLHYSWTPLATGCEGWMEGGGGGGERELPRSQGASKPCIAGEISPAPRPSRNDSVAFVSQTAKQWSRKRQIGKLRNQDCQLACYSRSCLVTRPRARGCTWRFYEAGPT